MEGPSVINMAAPLVCDPDSGCTVCEACCAVYIGAGSACESCAAAQCGKTMGGRAKGDSEKPGHATQTTGLRTQNRPAKHERETDEDS